MDRTGPSLHRTNGRKEYTQSGAKNQPGKKKSCGLGQRQPAPKAKNAAGRPGNADEKSRRQNANSEKLPAKKRLRKREKSGILPGRLAR